MILLFAMGCHMTIDFVVHQAIHCSNVGTETCEGEEEYWDKSCLPCEEPYDWNREYNWFAQTLEEGETLREFDVELIENIRLLTKDEQSELDLFYIPSHGENPKTVDTLLLYNHGNKIGIEHYIPRIRYLYQAGYNILTWDYRGYGKAGNAELSDPTVVTTPEQWFEDTIQVLEYAMILAEDPNKIVTYANSVGSIPAVEQILTDLPCAYIQEAGFLSIRQNAIMGTTVALPGGFLSQGLFENDIKIQEYDGPVFVMSGTVDDRNSIEEVRDFYELIRGPKDLWELEGVNHGIKTIGVPEAGVTEYLAKMEEFLQAKAPGCLTLAE